MLQRFWLQRTIWRIQRYSQKIWNCLGSRQRQVRSNIFRLFECTIQSSNSKQSADDNSRGRSKIILGSLTFWLRFWKKGHILYPHTLMHYIESWTQSSYSIWDINIWQVKRHLRVLKVPLPEFAYRPTTVTGMCVKSNIKYNDCKSKSSRNLARLVPREPLFFKLRIIISFLFQLFCFSLQYSYIRPSILTSRNYIESEESSKYAFQLMRVYMLDLLPPGLWSRVISRVICEINQPRHHYER